MAYLLDTNIISPMLRDPRGPVALRIAGLADRPHTSIIVVAELRFGIDKARSARLEAQLDSVLAGIEVVPFTEPADRFYGRLRADLERSGQMIGPNDLLIAAQCLAGDFVLVTDNIREFSRVPSLKVENWIR
jgi:tRNA(fMet)-specific endonuclease VapC